MKIYVNACVYYDYAMCGGYASLEDAKADQCYNGNLVFRDGYNLESIKANRWLRMCIATMLIVTNCRKLGIAKEDITICITTIDCSDAQDDDMNFEDVEKEIQRMVIQNYDVKFGKWMFE